MTEQTAIAILTAERGNAQTDKIRQAYDKAIAALAALPQETMRADAAVRDLIITMDRAVRWDQSGAGCMVCRHMPDSLVTGTMRCRDGCKPQWRGLCPDNMICEVIL